MQRTSCTFPHADRYSDRDPHTDGDAHPNADTYRDRDIYAVTIANNHTNTDRDMDSHPDPHGQQHA